MRRQQSLPLRRRFIGSAIALLMGLACGLPAHADTYPSKPVRILIPYAPGGGADNAARSLANFLTKEMGQSFVVDNRGGASNQVARSQEARRAKMICVAP